jgi:hypothetical protein
MPHSNQKILHPAESSVNIQFIKLTCVGYVARMGYKINTQQILFAKRDAKRLFKISSVENKIIRQSFLKSRLGD